MTCNLCGSNEATIHLTEIVNNQMMEIHLCEACAQEKGTAFKTHFNSDDLFSGFYDLMEPSSKKAPKKLAAKCSKCSMTYDQFGKAGRLGCSGCYEAFSDLLLPLIKRVQRSTNHIGKKPKKMTGSTRANSDLSRLQDRLRKSIQSEAFEEAAQLRDQIKKLQTKMTKKKSSS